MTTQDPKDEQLRTLFPAAFPAAEPPDALARRVAQLAAAHDQKAPRRAGQRRQWRLSLAAAAAVAVVAVLITAWPTFVAAQALYRMAGVMDDARSAHMVVWNVVAGGSRTKSREVWYQRGQWRMEDPSSVQIWSRGTMWRYNAQSKLALVSRHTPGPFGFSQTGFSMASMLRDAARAGSLGTGKIEDLGVRDVDGRRAHQVSITILVHTRMIVSADAATDMPYRIDYQQDAPGGWKTDQIGEMEYNMPLPASLFAPQFPPGTRIVDAAAAQDEWRRKFATGMAHATFQGKPVVIHDFQVNARGDVFMLYAGNVPQDVDFAYILPGHRLRPVHQRGTVLQDDVGTIYLASPRRFQPSTEAAGHPELSRGLKFNGQALEGVWWVPLTPNGTQGPRRFTLTLQQQRFGPDGKLLPGGLHTSLSLTVDGPSCALLPDYMPYVGSPLSQADVARGEAQSRADYYRDTAHALTRALYWYQQVVSANEAESRAIGQHVNEPETWFAIYAVLRDLGRRGEAKAALLRARDEDVYHNDGKQIDAALKAEGMN